MIIPNSVISINSQAFFGCFGLKSIIIPRSVISIEDMVFIGCEKLKIYCEAENKPEDWVNNWDCNEFSFSDKNRCKVVWGYKK
jgi:hypothetical protein